MRTVLATISEAFISHGILHGTVFFKCPKCNTNVVRGRVDLTAERVVFGQCNECGKTIGILIVEEEGQTPETPKRTVYGFVED